MKQLDEPPYEGEQEPEPQDMVDSYYRRPVEPNISNVDRGKCESCGGQS